MFSNKVSVCLIGMKTKPMENKADGKQRKKSWEKIRLKFLGYIHLGTSDKIETILIHRISFFE